MDTKIEVKIDDNTKEAISDLIALGRDGGRATNSLLTDTGNAATKKISHAFAHSLALLGVYPHIKKQIGEGKIIEAEYINKLEKLNQNAALANENDVLALLEKSAAIREIQKEINRIKIALRAIEYAQEETDITNEPLDEDFYAYWEEQAGTITSEKLQDIWARTLAKAAANPAHISLRTLHFIRCLPPHEAQLIEKLFSLVIGGHFFLPFEQAGQPFDSKLELAKEFISFEELLELCNLGILASRDNLGVQIIFDKTETQRKEPVFGKSYGAVLISQTNNISESFPISPLSELGKKLYSIIPVITEENYVKLWAECVRNACPYLKIELVKKNGNIFESVEIIP